jgi:putative transposase
MIDRTHALPVIRQARELGISRGSVYYLPRPTSAADLAIMRRLDELHMDFPFAGSRMLRDLLAADGVKVGRLHVSTLMKKMAIEAIYRRPITLKPAVAATCAMPWPISPRPTTPTVCTLGVPVLVFVLNARSPRPKLNARSPRPKIVAITDGFQSLIDGGGAM